MKLLILLAFLGLASACMDRREDCHNMKLYCTLDTYRDWVKKWCPQTCNLCGGPETPKPTTPKPITQKPDTQNPDTQKPDTHDPNTPHPPIVTTPTPGECGISSIQKGRVVAGTTPRRGAWPWQVLMSYNGRAGCGGTLVAPNWVITAAHCVYGKERNARSFTIRVGEHNRKSREGSEANVQVVSVHRHPAYNRRNFQNDIAMFKLATPVKLNNYVKLACLPDGPIPAGTECFITGWGKTNHPGSMTNVLQQGKLSVVDSRTCENLNRRTIPHPITNSMLCAGSGGRSRTSGCHGDSGGPFVCKRGGRWEVHGAVSHGSNDCRSSKTYTVFANVANLRSWIDQTMRS